MTTQNTQAPAAPVDGTELDESVLMTMAEANAFETEMIGHLDAAFVVLANESIAWRFGDATFAELALPAAIIANGMATLHAATIIAKSLRQQGNGEASHAHCGEKPGHAHSA